MLSSFSTVTTNGDNSRLQVVSLKFDLVHNGDEHVVGSGAGVLVFLVGEDVGSDNRGLGRSMLSWLGSGIVIHLAGEALEHAVTSLLDRASLGGDTVG